MLLGVLPESLAPVVALPWHGDIQLWSQSWALGTGKRQL